MHASLATTADVASWLEIVCEVEPLFGPMPDFETTLFRKINQRAALCVRSDNQHDPAFVLGGILLGRAPPQVWIRWFAVRSLAPSGVTGEFAMGIGMAARPHPALSHRELNGRWSMIHIFMESLLGALVAFGSVITIEPVPALSPLAPS